MGKRRDIYCQAARGSGKSHHTHSCLRGEWIEVDILTYSSEARCGLALRVSNRVVHRAWAPS